MKYLSKIALAVTAVLVSIGLASAQPAPPPATVPPATVPPATEPPATVPPATEPPATEPEAVPTPMPTPTPVSVTPAPVPAEPPAAAITVAGYVEAYDQVHLQNPSNRITNLRGFDNRSRTVALSNVAVDVKGEKGPVATRIMLQIGSTPSTYYLAKNAGPGTGSVNATSSELWKYLQTAMVTLKAPRDVTVEVGLFTSPIGPEVIPVKDNWNWSRSNLFFGLPFYHTGVHVYRPLGGGWTGKLHVYDGWNTVVDNNGYPSVGASLAYADETTTAQLLYLGGIERAAGAPEGKAWRHLFDALIQRAITDRLSVLAHADAGVEPNDLGTSSWVAGALYGKLALSSRLYVAARADYFRETVAKSGGVTASAIFWPTKWMASGTATLAYQPTDGVSILAEGARAAAQDPPDLILLDLGLPDGDGLDLVVRLREWTTVPIIVLSARGREDDKVAALDGGADDYLTKPFGVRELFARIRVALRHGRTAGGGAGAVLEVGPIRVDDERHQVTVGGAPVHLTPIEYRLLVLLARDAGKVLTHRHLLKEIWGPNAVEHVHYLRVHMASLRRKVEVDAARPAWLITGAGVGYRLRDAPA